MRLLEHFKELSLHPKNYEELKGLILQLAVQGKLTASWRAENSNIESAAVLFHKIQEEKTELVKEKKIRNELVKKRFAKSTTEFEVPDTWKSCNLTDVYYTIGGKENQIKTKEYQDKGSYPVVSQGKNLIEGYSNDESKVLRILKPVVVFGDHTRAIKLIDFDFIIGADGVKVLVPCTHILSEYFFFYLSSIDLSSRGYARHYSHLKNEPFSLPPVKEQKAIVEVVNTLFEEVEQLESLTKERIRLKESFVVSALTRLTEAKSTLREWNFLQQYFSSFFTEKRNIKSLRETILQLAVQGKLTSKWREDNPKTEPASELLKRVEAKKQKLIAEKKIKKEKPLPPVEDNEIPYDLPDSWKWCRMQEVGLFERGKSKHRPRNDNRLFHEGQYPLVQTGDVSASKNTRGIISTNKSFYNDFGLQQSRMWNKGTLCITIAANIAETGFLGFNACFPDSIVGFTDLIGCNESISKYVDCYITLTKSDLERYAPSTAQKNINLGILYELIFPLPPLLEQQVIVEKVNSLMALCDQLEEEITLKEEQAALLMQSCVAETLA